MGPMGATGTRLRASRDDGMAADPLDLALAWDGLRSLGPIWEELARRMGASDRPVCRIRVSGLDDQGRRTLASLLRLQRVPVQPIVTLDAVKIGSALGLEDEAQLRLLVERIRGPIGNRAADRAATSEARAALWRRATERLGVRTPETLARIRAAGVPDGAVDAHAQVLEMLADSLDSLPSKPPVPLPVLAWQVSGNPHALDADTACGRYLQLGAVELAGEWSAEREPNGSTIRRALQDLGVMVDRISSTTITYGLRAQPGSPLGRLLEAAGATRTPVGISGAMLDGASPRFPQRSWLCVENPSVVEGAMLAGCAGPLVCTAGWPSIDAQRLLDLARAQGIDLYYAGDYDSVGLAIANFMATRYEATIVMTEAAYLSADLRRAPAWGDAHAIPSTPWDEALADAIRDKRRVVYQEDPAVWRKLLNLDIGRPERDGTE